MKFERCAGILLHPTCLPGPYGIGDFGPSAYTWVEWLAATGCKLWQILPLGPTGFGNSPYQSFSAFAGNPYLISPQFLLEEGLLNQDDLVDMPEWNQSKANFSILWQWKPKLLGKAFARHKARQATNKEMSLFEAQNKYWLDDYALFMAIKEAQGGGPWSDWPVELRQRNSEDLSRSRKNLEESILRNKFFQFVFYKQWNRLKEYSNNRGVKIIGDIPIFVAMDSSDVWSHPDLFYLGSEGRPTVVAGVPPDYFSPTGQLWGNPLYRWEVHKADGYSWWLERIRHTLSTMDIVRIDHFRGFCSYWEIPGDSKTAEQGRWAPGPGEHFFEVLQAVLGEMPIIAEDLGEITPDVIALRDKFDLPGMKILQFAFSGPDNPFLPHQYIKNSVVYTGTHDNDTSRGWYDSAPEYEKDFARRYLDRSWRSSMDFAWDLIRSAWSSSSVLSLAPMQDFLALNTDARFNFPSQLGGNWEWRMTTNDLSENLKDRIRDLNWLYQR